MNNSISYVIFRESLLNYLNQKESQCSDNLIMEHRNLFDFELDFFPTSEDMVNNRDNIIKCINLTDDINLIMLHRSLYILQKKFKQNKESLKNIYKKYGEQLSQEEDLLIDEKYLPNLLKEIFNLNKFEISYVNDFTEALEKEMEYCKEINIEDYIFNDIIEFIRINRKRYNFIFREKRNNNVFNLENYDKYELNLVDDLTKEAKIGIVDENEINEENDENGDNNINNNNNKKRISSAKFINKLSLGEPLDKNKLKLNFNFLKNNDGNNDEYKDNNSYSYSESKDYSSPRTNRGKRSVGGRIINDESGSVTYRSNAKIKNEENVIVEKENEDEEKESNKINEKDEFDEKEEDENKSDKDNNDNNNDKNDNNDSNEFDEKDENDKNKKSQLLFSSKKKKINYVEKEFYETNYEEKPKNIKSVRYLKYYLYMEIIPLIIADFISDERNLYLILDHSDDFRQNLSSTFDVEILYKLGENCIEEVLNQRADKISDLKNNRKKVENNIENYEKILQEMKKKGQNITYIIITLQKLKDFLNWLNTKIHILENDNIIFKEYERNMKEKEKMNNMNSRNHGRINNNGGKSKRQVIVDNYQQLKRDFEIRKFILKKRKILNSNNKLNKIILKPINKNHSNEMNNSNNNSKNNISNIENDNSNNNIDSGEISEEYNNSFMLSERKMTKKKTKILLSKSKKS